MANAARLTIPVRRYQVARFTIRIAGIDLSARDVAMDVRLKRGLGGAPLIHLEKQLTTAAEGIKIEVVLENGIPVTYLRGRFNKSTMSDAVKVPYPQELGASKVLAFGIIMSETASTIAGGADAQERFYGDLIVYDSAYGSDAAPDNRPDATSGGEAAGGSDGNSVTFGDTIVNVDASGVGELTALIHRSEEQADLAAHYANDSTDADVPGGAPGSRGAKYWSMQAAADRALAFGFANDAGASAGFAGQAADGASAAAATSVAGRDVTTAARDATLGYRNDALTARDAAGASATFAGQAADGADAASSAAIAARDAAFGARDAAGASATFAGQAADGAAAASAAAAAARDGILNNAGFQLVATDLAAGGSGKLGIVSTNIANVNAVGSGIANVNAVANALTNIGIVAGGIVDVGTVAADLNLGAGSFIRRAPQAAVDAQSALSSIIAQLSNFFSVLSAKRPTALFGTQGWIFAITMGGKVVFGIDNTGTMRAARFDLTSYVRGLIGASAILSRDYLVAWTNRGRLGAGLKKTMRFHAPWLEFGALKAWRGADGNAYVLAGTNRFQLTTSADVVDVSSNDGWVQVIRDGAPTTDGFAATRAEEYDLRATTTASAGVTTLYDSARNGQSTSVGNSAVSGTASLTSAPLSPGRVLMFNGGIRVTDNVDSLRGGVPSYSVRPRDIGILVDAREQIVGVFGETGCAVQGARAIAGAPAAVALVYSAHGLNGASYISTSIGIGSQAHNNRLAVARQLKRIATMRGWTATCKIETSFVGESYYPQAVNSLRDAIVSYQSQNATLVNNIYGTAETIPLILGRPCSWTAPSSGWGGAAGSQLATLNDPLNAMLAQLSKLTIALPFYILKHVADGVHHLIEGEKLKGDYAGRVEREYYASGTLRRPLYCTAATATGTTLTLTFSKTGDALAFVTTLVTDPGQYGFRVFGGSGATRTLSAPSISGNQVTFTMSADLTGVTSPMVGIADVAPASALGGPTTGPRCCLAATSSDLASDGVTLMHDYALPQTIAIA